MSYYNVLLNFIKEHKENWIELLQEEPYFLKIKQCPFRDIDNNLLYPELYMLSYNMLCSSFKEAIVRACRGCIISIEDINNPKMICTPFYKFFNYGDDNCDEIDWKHTQVQDKCDGCLIKYFNYKDQWIWVTNNGWDINTETPETLPSRYSEPETDGLISFGQLKDYALTQVKINSDLSNLSKDYTYMFELISPKNRIICDYPKTKLILLGSRNKLTYQEYSARETKEIFKDSLGNFDVPEIFNLNKMDDAIDLCNSYKDSFHEGVVICDKNFHRIKIKCQHYMELKGFKGEIGFTDQKILDSIKNESIDDVIAAFPEIQKQVDIVKQNYLSYIDKIKEICKKGRETYTSLIEKLESENVKKAYANWVLNGPFSAYSKFLFTCIKEDEVQLKRLINGVSYDKILEELDNK